MIRAEDVSDIAAIHRVVTAAFTSVIHSNHKESLLVDELRNSGALSVSMVAECNGQIVGHVAFSPVTVDGHLCDWYGLAPLAVVPVYQRRGIGTRLVNAGLESLRVIGAEGCAVLGEPEYYRRFGFGARDKLILENLPRQFFLARSFTGAYAYGTVAYHRAFELCS
ncbi:MAG TPA: N-acetyltransferase [Candidatus Binatia bacterium]|nr:N-acetyltransferase [Candidatus Binatia bacterium]